MKRPLRRQAPRAGFTIIEVMITLVILTLLMVNGWMVTRAGRSAADSGVFMMSLDDEVNLTMDRITLAIMGADADEIYGPGMGSLATHFVEYQSNLGMSDGKVISGPPEEITWFPTTGPDGSVVWRESPTLPGEREVNWSNAVPTAAKEEIEGNGVDDNNNGIPDEAGLAFTKEGSRVDIYVTVEHVTKDGKRVPMDTANNVTCRN